MALLVQHRVDYPVAVTLAEALALQESLPLIVRTGDNGCPRRLYPSDEPLWAGVREALQCRGNLIRKAVAGIFAVTDGDLFETLHALWTQSSSFGDALFLGAADPAMQTSLLAKLTERREPYRTPQGFRLEHCLNFAVARKAD
jgi:hypothetical protein